MDHDVFEVDFWVETKRGLYLWLSNYGWHRMSPSCDQAKFFPATIALIIYSKMSPVYCKSKIICKHSTESRAAQAGSNCCITVMI